MQPEQLAQHFESWRLQRVSGGDKKVSDMLTSLAGQYGVTPESDSLPYLERSGAATGRTSRGTRRGWSRQSRRRRQQRRWWWRRRRRWPEACGQHGQVLLSSRGGSHLTEISCDSQLSMILCLRFTEGYNPNLRTKLNSSYIAELS